MKKIWNFIKDENGLETVEYAIIAGLIVVGVIAVIGAIGGNVLTIFTSLQDATGTAAS
jgi:pilus assembly protein Flp/PilA